MNEKLTKLVRQLLEPIMDALTDKVVALYSDVICKLPASMSDADKLKYSEDLIKQQLDTMKNALSTMDINKIAEEAKNGK